MRIHLASGVLSSLSNDKWFEFFDKEQRSPNNHLKLRRSIIAVSKSKGRNVNFIYSLLYKRPFNRDLIVTSNIKF